MFTETYAKGKSWVVLPNAHHLIFTCYMARNCWEDMSPEFQKTPNFKKFWNFHMVVSNIFYFHPYLGKMSILTNIFQMG